MARQSATDDLIARLQRELAEAREDAAALLAQLAAAEKYMAKVETEQAALIGAAYEVGAQWVRKRLDDYIRDYGSYDGSTGVTEFPGNGEEWVQEQEELIEALQLLTPTDATAALATVRAEGRKEGMMEAAALVPNYTRTILGQTAQEVIIAAAEKGPST